MRKTPYRPFSCVVSLFRCICMLLYILQPFVTNKKNKEKENNIDNKKENKGTFPHCGKPVGCGKPDLLSLKQASVSVGSVQRSHAPVQYPVHFRYGHTVINDGHPLFFTGLYPRLHLLFIQHTAAAVNN